MSKHILVTGAHRSGTTFVGKVLSVPHSVGYIHEPMNRDWGLVGVDDEFPYVYEGSPDESLYAERFSRLLKKRATFRVPRYLTENGSRPSLLRSTFKSRPSVHYQLLLLKVWQTRLLVKDPLACLASEWIHRRFGLDVVILVRHPAAFVASLMRVNWRFDFKNFLSRDDLMRTFLEPYEQEVVDKHAISQIHEGALLWKCLYRIMSEYADRNPRMFAVRHEDLSTEPVPRFRELYATLDLPFDRRVEKTIVNHTHGGNAAAPRKDKVMDLKRDSRANAKRWRKVLDPKDVETIRSISEPLAGRFYSDADW